MLRAPEKWPVIKDRISYIGQLTTGLDVLDVGCTGKKANGRIPHPGPTLHQSNLSHGHLQGLIVMRMASGSWNRKDSRYTVMILRQWTCSKPLISSSRGRSLSTW